MMDPKKAKVWFAGNEVYHTHEECRSLGRGKNVRQITLAEAERRDLRQCALPRCERTDPGAYQ